ncbi:hypothetical protein [Alkalicoccobacillus murimartini]|uniref:DUF3139 domain-containing protein n=1 Tax=Alkalicoccobacillus murimartini TaxID=171685 RepID=A0ABT9YLD6_9BACI|nr:hypothetical protein [Alkalicoccobacillus murimartini]MDQ0208670.1 hypothetical protein [Alkalicoccobacillus murimartini]
MMKSGLILSLILLIIALVDFKKGIDRDDKTHKLILNHLGLQKGQYSIHSFGDNPNEFLITSSKTMYIIRFDNYKKPSRIVRTEVK